jgi:hypothetical protein
MKLQNHNKGFSFIGVTVATFIAMVGIMGVFSLANMSLSAAQVSKMRLIASGLAQEGVEIIRDIRKSNTDWRDWEWYSTTTPMAHPVGSSEEYCVQYNTASLSDPGCSSPEDPIKLDTSLGLYGVYQYGDGEDTSFYRKVTLTRLSKDQVKVVVEVKWQIKGKSDWHYLIIEDRLWNWK